ALDARHPSVLPPQQLLVHIPTGTLPMPPEPADDRCMTITERPSSAAEGEDLPRRALEAVCARGPIGLAEEIGDATHLLVELLREPQNLFDPEEHGSHDYTQLLGRIHEAGSALGALQAHTVVSHAAATRREDRRAARDQAAHEADAIAPQARTDDRADQRSGKDLSLITRRSPSEASHALRASRRLVESMPNLLGALTDGKITAEMPPQAAPKAGSLEPEECRELDRLLGERLPDPEGAGTRRWGQEISAAIQGLDPDGAVGRHQRARRERCVTLRPGEHGMATLSARLPGIDAAQAHKRLSSRRSGCAPTATGAATRRSWPTSWSTPSSAVTTRWTRPPSISA